MRALVYEGPRQLSVADVPDARIEPPTDVLVRITSTNICGSDLHMYEGRTDVEKGKVLGHENLGEVIEVGYAVVRVKAGDWVCLPFNIGCGFRKNCERGFTGFCLTVNPGFAGGAYGYASMGPYSGGQAELLRVPYGDFNCLRLPPDAKERQADYVMLSDIWPTGYHATELADVAAGDSVGCGVRDGRPDGRLFGAVARCEQGTGRRPPARPVGAGRTDGAVAIDQSKGDPVEQVLDHTGGEGADKGCECVGWQAHDPQGNENPNMTMNQLVGSVRATGAIGVVGVFVPEEYTLCVMLFR